MGGATWILGWRGIALLALVAGYLFRTKRGSPWWIALAASEAWTGLLILDAASGSFASLASVLQGVMKIPSPALVVATVLFPALLAWSAAVVVREMTRTR